MPSESLLRIVSSDPSPSCRTDFLTISLKLPNREAEDDLFAYWYSLCEKLLPTKEATLPSKGRYYQRLYNHSCGSSFEWSPIDSDETNAGSALLTFTGTQFGLLDASERRDLMVDLYKWPGFVRCTRWDGQITVLDPPITIDHLVDNVEAGRLWVTKYSTAQPWVQRNSNGVIQNKPTQYFGSPQSKTRLRIYDHGAKHNWNVASLRVELQTRKETADQWFRRMARRAYDERHVEPIFVTQEERTVKDALSQHADFRDTSAYEGRPKPKKWAQSAPTPDWWTEMLAHKADPLKLQHKVETDIDRAVEVMIEQYGRKFFLWVYSQSFCREKDTDHVLHEVMVRCAAKLKKGDDDVLASLVPWGHKGAARGVLKEAENLIAKYQEQNVPEG